MKESQYIYNPDDMDFSVVFNSKEYTIPANEIKEFDYAVAEHIKKHLTDHIYHKRGQVNNYETDKADIMSEIEVTL